MQRQETERPSDGAAPATRRRRLVAATVGWLGAGPSARQTGEETLNLKFRAQEIATDFGVGYAVATGDVNADGRVDVLAISGTDLVWFENPTWTKHTMLGPGATVADDVALAPPRRARRRLASGRNTRNVKIYWNETP